jgi:hypothetical protein
VLIGALIFDHLARIYTFTESFGVEQPLEVK